MPSGVHLLPADKGLPGGEPLLLRHVELCCVGLKADKTAFIAEAAPAVPLMSAQSGRSQWAQLLAGTLQTLGQLLGDGEADASEATATAVLEATLQLIGHEVGTREPLPLPGTKAAAANSDTRLHSALNTCLRLRGPAAAAAQHSLLQKMAAGLTAVSGRLAEALPAHAAASASEAARPAAASPDQAAVIIAMTAMANEAHCNAKINAICISSQGPQFLLAPGCESGRAWVAAISGALKTIARCFELAALATLEDFVGTTVTAASCLAGVAGVLLRRRVAAGLAALQQEAGMQLVETLAVYVACESQTSSAFVRS